MERSRLAIVCVIAMANAHCDSSRGDVSTDVPSNQGSVDAGGGRDGGGKPSSGGKDAADPSDAEAPPDTGSGGGDWTGLRVDGTSIVDGAGKEVILRGFGVGELYNIEAYMINVESPDQGGMGQTKLQNALVTAMGQADADKFFKTWEANIVTPADVAQ